MSAFVMSRGPETLTKMDNSIDVSREEKEAAKAFWPGDHPSLPLSPITPPVQVNILQPRETFSSPGKGRKTRLAISRFAAWFAPLARATGYIRWHKQPIPLPCF